MKRISKPQFKGDLEWEAFWFALGFNYDRRISFSKQTDAGNPNSTFCCLDYVIHNSLIRCIKYLSLGVSGYAFGIKISIWHLTKFTEEKMYNIYTYICM